MKNYLLSTIIGIIGGTLYAFLFTAQRRKLFMPQPKSGWRTMIGTTRFTILRLALFALFTYYVLLTPTLDLILLLGCFFVTLWLMLLWVKKYVG